MSDQGTTIRRFEDLRVWQDARTLVRGVYRATRCQPLKGDWALCDQMKRAAVSIVSNIAEGHERGSRTENIQFCYVAKGSAGELRAQLTIAHDVELLDDACFAWLHKKCDDVTNQLGAYIRHLQDSKASIRGSKFPRVRDGQVPTRADEIVPSDPAKGKCSDA